MTTPQQSAGNSKRLTFRMATPADTPAIVQLLNATFRAPIDEATWEWYVYGNPAGPSQVYAALTTGDELAGIIGYAPAPLWICGESIVADYAHHLVFRPDFRDTLSYVSLLRHSLKGQQERGVSFVFGPPNQRAYPIHKMLMKWFDYGYLDRLRKLSPEIRDHTCKPVSGFGAEFNDFYRQVSATLRFGLRKTDRWMNWRFLQRPGKPYAVYVSSSQGSMNGYVVLKQWQDDDGYRKTHIIDMHALNEAALENLLAAADSWAAERGSQEVNLWAIQGYAYRAQLERLGFSCDHRQPLLARTFDGRQHPFPDGLCSLSYGDGDSLY